MKSNKIVQELLFSLILVFFLCSSVFVLMRVLPGDPVDFLLGVDSSALQKDVLRHQLGLDLPLFKSLWQFWSGVLRGDWGQSIFFEKPVFSLILNRLGFSFLLAFVSLFLSSFFCLIVLYFSWIKPWLNRPLKFLSAILMSLPVFFLAPLLVWFFSVKLSLLPVTGAYEAKYFVLPCVCLAVGYTGLFMRSLLPRLEELSSKMFVVTAFSKGLSHSGVYWGHVFKNILIPLVALQAFMFGRVVSGAVLVESIFDIPGLGLLFYEAVLLRDLPLVVAVVLFIGLCYSFVNFIADLIISKLDRRVNS